VSYELTEGTPKPASGESCPSNTWPYTENNVCVRRVGHEGDHIDALGRTFTHAGYNRTAAAKG
jgi:hypothetical protein